MSPSSGVSSLAGSVRAPINMLSGAKSDGLALGGFRERLMALAAEQESVRTSLFNRVPSTTSLGSYTAGGLTSLGGYVSTGSSIAVSAAGAMTPSKKNLTALGPLPVPASKYQADTSDLMDVAFSRTLWGLDAYSLAALWLRRLSRSKYEIDGRRVTVVCQNNEWDKLIVCEDDVPRAEWTPLLDYFLQAAGVSMSLAASSGQNPASDVQRGVVIQESDSMIDNVMSEDESVSKIASMKLACSEARMTVVSIDV